jgi:RhoGAP domain
MPREHSATLAYLMRFLREVASLSHVNSMDAHNLASIFSPTILRPPTNNLESAFSDLTRCQRILMLLIKGYGHPPPTSLVPIPPKNASSTALPPKNASSTVFDPFSPPPEHTKRRSGGNGDTSRHSLGSNHSSGSRGSRRPLSFNLGGTELQIPLPSFLENVRSSYMTSSHSNHSGSGQNGNSNNNSSSSSSSHVHGADYGEYDPATGVRVGTITESNLKALEKTQESLKRLSGLGVGSGSSSGAGTGTGDARYGTVSGIASSSSGRPMSLPHFNRGGAGNSETSSSTMGYVLGMLLGE